jgi:hypothetical protein
MAALKFVVTPPFKKIKPFFIKKFDKRYLFERPAHLIALSATPSNSL